MNIVPIWKSTYCEVPAPRVEYRVLCDGGEIFHGRAVKSPTEDKIRIWLNPICADFLNSQIAPEFLSSTGDTYFPMEAYQEFSVEAYNELTGLWETAMEVAFYNDTSYEERNTLNLSEPINGHSAAGQILPYSVFTGDTGTCCFGDYYLNFTSYPEQITSAEQMVCFYYDTDCSGKVKYELYSGDTASGTWHSIATGITADLSSTCLMVGDNVESEPRYFRMDIAASNAGSDTKYVAWDSVVIKQEEKNYENEYLTYVILTGGTMVWKTNGEVLTYYSTNGGATWNEFGTGDTTINVSEGNRILLKGESQSGAYGMNGYNCFTTASTATYDVNGNTMSLCYMDNFTGQTSFPTAYGLSSFFSGTKVRSAKHLCLPATTIPLMGYYGLFKNCEYLVEAPSLPCLSLSEGCYQEMFSGCVSLVTAPELPAATLPEYCYANMYRGCVSLSSVRCLATTVSGDNVCKYWMRDTPARGKFYIAAGSNIWTTGESGIPAGWTIIEV